MLRTALLAAASAFILTACGPDDTTPPPADPAVPGGAPASDPATPGAPAGDPAAPAGQTPPATQGAAQTAPAEADECAAGQYADLVGQSADAVDESDLPDPSRVYERGDAVTMDYRPDRLNVIIGVDGNVEEVSCG